MTTTVEKPKVYGLIAEFDKPETLLKAAKAAHDAGYRKMDAYSPFPIEDLSDVLGQPRTWLTAIVFFGGLFGGLAGLGLAYYAEVIDYPKNIGGRPHFSWPAFIPVIFECTVLGAATSAVFGMLGLNGLPRPYHPLFNVPSFDRASRDGFFLCITADDPKYGPEATTDFLNSLHALHVTEVPE